MVDEDAGTWNTGAGTGRWSPDRPTTASKRSLVAVSHAIESAVLAGATHAPTVVVALFQHEAYFSRECAVYERIAASGVVVVLAFADGEPHDVPPGCQLVVLDPAEPLADEWSVVAVGPEAGAFLVATDAHRIDPTEYTLEAGREFIGRWGWSRVQAANELARMRSALGPRLDTAVGYTIDGLLARVMPAGGVAAASGGTDGERWATHALHRMVQRMQDAREGTRVLRAQLVDAHAAVAARTAATTDPQSGLTTPEFLARWTNTGGPTALPVGVALIDVEALDDAENRLGRRAAYHAARRVATAVSEPLGPVDAAIRLSEREFALVVPGASSRHLAGLVDAVVEQLELSSDGYPNVPLAGPVAWTVTLTRPLPLDDLHLALGTPDQPATTLAGDPITVRELGGAASGSGSGAHHRQEPVTDRMPRVRVPDAATTAPPELSELSEPAEPVLPRAELLEPVPGVREADPVGAAGDDALGEPGVPDDVAGDPLGLGPGGEPDEEPDDRADDGADDRPDELDDEPGDRRGREAGGPDLPDSPERPDLPDRPDRPDRPGRPGPGPAGSPGARPGPWAVPDPVGAGSGPPGPGRAGPGRSDGFDPFGAAVPPRSGPFGAPVTGNGTRGGPATGPPTNGNGAASATDTRPAGPSRGQGPAPSPSPRGGRRRLTGGESALSMLQDLPRRPRRDGLGPGRTGRGGAPSAGGDGGTGGSSDGTGTSPTPGFRTSGDAGGDPPPTAS
ncbi:DICT sensory domain-containing protein [Actinomycetospora aeridis]|uniref:DICT sensory domain-containing protein n=1 Tax=Actinomycetospora aeridis TaxID=3129231 RepID=A0ABU8N3C8_9PSEU